MTIISNLGVAIGTGETAMNGIFVFVLGYEKRDLPPPGILFGERFILVTAQASRMIGSPNNA
jgi:hypothetical protein